MQHARCCDRFGGLGGKVISLVGGIYFSMVGGGRPAHRWSNLKVADSQIMTCPGLWAGWSSIWGTLYFSWTGSSRRDLLTQFNRQLCPTGPFWIVWFIFLCLCSNSHVWYKLCFFIENGHAKKPSCVMIMARNRKNGHGRENTFCIKKCLIYWQYRFMKSESSICSGIIKHWLVNMLLPVFLMIIF